MSSKVRLGVNVDHVATLREARKTTYPCPVQAALLAEKYGADLITVHLREDRRHIQEDDVIRLTKKLTIPLNLEIANTEEMLDFVLKLDKKPTWVCYVPEKREELTTEGGLNLKSQPIFDNLLQNIKILMKEGIKISLFIDPDLKDIELARELGVHAIEIHTGKFASSEVSEQLKELTQIQKAAEFAKSIGLQVHAGHGLHLGNMDLITNISEIEELNIGHSIVSESIFVGFANIIKEYSQFLKGVF